MSILGQIAFMLAIGALTGPSRHARGIDGEIGSVGFTLFGIWQIVSVYRLSLALGEAHPLRRLGSMFLPFASLSVLIAVHSKAVRRLRRA